MCIIYNFYSLTNCNLCQIRKFNRGINYSSFKALYGHEAYNGLEIVNNLNMEQKKGIKTAEELFTVLGDQNRLAVIIDDDEEDQEVELIASSELLADAKEAMKRPVDQMISDEEEEARIAKRRAIERSRTTASKGQEKQAVRMLKMNKKHINSQQVINFNNQIIKLYKIKK